MNKRNSMSTKVLALILVMMVVISSMPGLFTAGAGKAYAATKYIGGGSGTVEDPYTIADADQLDDARYFGNNTYFKLTADINLSEYLKDTDNGWEPIGSDESPFNGNVNGNGHTITGLWIDSSIKYVGLFGAIGKGGSITNMALENVDITGNSYTAGLAGKNEGSISNSYVKGTVNGNVFAGFLVAENFGTVSNSYSEGSIDTSGLAGGLVGVNGGTISKSHSTAVVTGDSTTVVNGTSTIGGLVGFNYDASRVSDLRISEYSVASSLPDGSAGIIIDSYATGSVENSDNSKGGAVGGLAGVNLGTISNSNATGNVKNSDNTDGVVGGLVGGNGGTINNSFAKGNVDGTNFVGGLVGDTSPDSLISNSNAKGTVSGNGNVGGLVGSNSGTIDTNYATGSVTGIDIVDGDDSYSVGGLVGYNANAGIINKSYASGNVTGNYDVGGLVGYSNSNSEISNSHATGTVSGISSVGGLVGSNSGTIDTNYATGSVTGIDIVDGDDSYSVGGLVGYNANAGIINKSYASGKVYGYGEAGGLIGTSYGTINTSYATGNVAGEYSVGGLVGYFNPQLNGTINNSYSIGNVSGSEDVGGLVGYATHAGVVHNSFYNTDTSGQVDTGKGVGKSSDEMKKQETYTYADSGWNFVNDWYMRTNQYPQLLAFWKSDAATLTSTIGTVSANGTASATITNIPNATTLAAFKAAITPAAGATVQVYDADGTTVATVLATGTKVIVTAEDGITKVTYTVTVNAAPGGDNGNGNGAITTPSNDKVTSTDGRLTLPVGRTGEVSLDNEVTISIPAGATSEELKLTIAKILETQKLLTNNEVPASSVFEILKNFTNNFIKPVTLSFVFDSSKVKSNQRAAVFFYDEVKKVWVEVTGGQTNGNRITVEVNHFTKYAVLVVDQTTNKPEQPTDPAVGITFSDIAGHWAEASIKQAVSGGIVKGYTDGTFKPGKTVTRAEFAVMLMNALKPQGEGAALTFTDKAEIGAWAQQAVAQAVQAGIIKGYEGGTFRPNAVITRVEMAAMIANTLKLASESNSSTGFADDKDIPSWAKGAVGALKKFGLLEGKGGNKFDPTATATRAEAVTVILKMLTQVNK
ncbi:hypothetical protein Back11_38120 [Paenibacillus baekrokdamisoli]|uniref:Uncharacterized protein n=1 Tax=Paenibacillus baekrokdamisoli TaxID=1712516 RepID=A0A3G9IUA8_9BACL|nr:S-layer homology domain-containing protein [Paenibacillus baekrokdamisoli]MBB3068492.1 hypothetical protein [Paenibacillus baekrokdamisoli]BBH22467.1 hypothetical protein Back11_38120 [Paenibacillus baekrokdamisoli]